MSSLSTAPGQSIRTGGLKYVIPNVLVRKHSGRWTVNFNVTACMPVSTSTYLGVQ